LKGALAGEGLANARLGQAQQGAETPGGGGHIFDLLRIYGQGGERNAVGQHHAIAVANIAPQRRHFDVAFLLIASQGLQLLILEPLEVSQTSDQADIQKSKEPVEKNQSIASPARPSAHLLHLLPQNILSDPLLIEFNSMSIFYLRVEATCFWT
jgi:hypothetical protein